MANTMKALVGSMVLGLALLAGSMQGCDSGGGSKTFTGTAGTSGGGAGTMGGGAGTMGGSETPLSACNQGCAKVVECLMGAITMADCTMGCADKFTTCTNASAVLPPYKACQAMT